MLLTHGFNTVADTLNELSTLFRAQPQSGTKRAAPPSLRDQFQAFLSGCQPRIPRVGGKHPTALVEGETWGDLTGVLRETPEFQSISVTPSPAAPGIATLCLETIAELAEQIPHFDTLFDAAIDALVFADADKAYGGTPEHTLGVLWINPHLHWTRPIMREFLVQQFTQALLNIDRYRHGHTCSHITLNGRNPNVNSQKARTALNSLHSVVTASEIITLRAQITGEPTPATIAPVTSQLVDTTLAAARTLRADNQIHGLLSPRAMALLDTARNAIQHAMTPLEHRPPDHLGSTTTHAAPAHAASVHAASDVAAR